MKKTIINKGFGKVLFFADWFAKPNCIFIILLLLNIFS